MHHVDTNEPDGTVAEPQIDSESAAQGTDRSCVAGSP